MTPHLLHPYKRGDRLHLPWLAPGVGHLQGTVVDVTDRMFQVTWDSHGRNRGQSRQRTWHPWHDAPRFKPGKPSA